MAKRSTSGSSVVINNEIHFKGEKTEIKGRGENCTPVSRSEKVKPVNAEDYVQMLLGAMPASVDGQGISGQESQMLGGIAAAGMIEVTQNPQTANLMLNYVLSLLKVVDGAYAKNGILSEEELKNLIASNLSQMLENAGPAYANWNQVLADAMRQETMTGFLKGIQPAICAITGDPVNAGTGNFIYEKEDLRINGRAPLFFKRSYNRIDTRTGTMGKGWRHNYEIQLLTQEDRYVVLWEDGREELYLREEGNTPVPLFGGFCRLKKNGEGFLYETQDKAIFTFDGRGSLLKLEDLNGQVLQFLYNKQGYLACVSNKYGASINYHYDKSSGMLIQVTDHTGRSVNLNYELGRLKEVKNADGHSYFYSYDADKNICGIRNPLGLYVLDNKYDGRGRTTKQKFADGGAISYDYQEDLSRTLVTDQNGGKIAYVHDEKFRNVKTIYMDGEEKFSYNERNLLVSKTDKKGNKTKYSYDDRGNNTQIIYPDGEKRNMTYDVNNRLLVLSVNGTVKQKNIYDTNGKLIKTTNALGKCWEIKYDEKGNAAKLLQPDASQVSLEYDNHGNIIRVIDGALNEVSYEYDLCNRIVRAIDGNGNQVKFAYDICDRITGVTNAAGKCRTYAYTKNGSVARMTDFNGSMTNWDYNNMNQVKSITVPGGGKTCMEYDLMQNMTKRILPNGAALSYTYNSFGRLEQVILPNGAAVHYEYDLSGNRTAVTNANGNRTSLEYDERNRIAAITDPAGAKTEYRYDMEGNLISITNALGKSCTYSYNEAGQKISETDILGNTIRYEYNELGKITCVTDPKQRKTFFEYAPGGILKRKVFPDSRFESYTYDKNMNLIRCQNHKGDSLEFAYDCLNRMVNVSSSFGQKKSYIYDAVGNVTSITDALGHVGKYEYSLSGALTAVTDAAGNKVEYSYDLMGNLISICQHKGSSTLLDGDYLQKNIKQFNAENGVHFTQYERNALGKVVEVTDPLGRKENYSYNEAGQMILKQDKEGYETCYSYTQAGDLEQIKYGDGKSVTYSYNPLRQLTEIRDWLGTTRIEPDDAGRAKKISDYKGREVSYQWSKTGEQEALVYPDGRKVVYEYDNMSRLSSLADGEREVKYYYNDDGLLIEKVFSGGVTSSYRYNAMGLLCGLTHRSGDKDLEQYSYEYDLLGNKTQIRKLREELPSSDVISDRICPQPDQESGIYRYQYDCLNHLTKVEKNKETLREYQYDAFGNRISKKEERKTINYSYNAANQLVKISGGNADDSFRYDGRGNVVQISQGGETICQYDYDAASRLVKAVNARGESSSYQYNGLGNRVSRQEYAQGDLPENVALSEILIKEEEYLLDLTKPYHNLLEKTEKVEDKTTIQGYIWDSNAVFMTEGEMSHIYLQDELGSTVRLIEMQKNFQTVYGYDEFGRDLYERTGDNQPFGYTGYRKDCIANTYFAQAREYMPDVGRFSSQDIVKGNIIYPHTLNEYSYCLSNPMKWVDLDGRRPEYPSPTQVWGAYFEEAKKSAARAWVKGGQYIEDRIDAVFDVTVEVGAGLGAKTATGAVKVGVVAKAYVEVDEHLDAAFKETAGVSVGVPDTLELNAEITLDENSEKPSISTGLNDALFDGHFKMKFGGEVYAGIGGGGYITVDLNEAGGVLVDLGKGVWDYLKDLTDCASQR